MNAIWSARWMPADATRHSRCPCRPSWQGRSMDGSCAELHRAPLNLAGCTRGTAHAVTQAACTGHHPSWLAAPGAAPAAASAWGHCPYVER